MTFVEFLLIMILFTNSLCLMVLLFLVTAVRFIGAHIIKFLQEAGNKLKAFGGSGGSGGLLGGIGDIVGLISGLGGGGEAK